MRTSTTTFRDLSPSHPFWAVIITGAVAGVLAPLLVWLGNPGNMGLCVACFTRDIAGAIGLHQAAPVQYLRPEVPGLALGALLAALAYGEFKPRSGSAAALRFLWGLLAALGALVFLGCPWRALLRLAGGDWNALLGLAGHIAGVGVGTLFLRMGYSMGRSRPAPAPVGWVMPALMAGLLALLVATVRAGEHGSALLAFSESGPGAAHAPVAIGLAAGLLVGFLAQRSRFCTVGAFRNLFLLRDFHLFWGVAALAAAALATNLALGFFNPGWAGQPVAHTDGLWNFLGMTLAGVAFTLGGGCPARQLILVGEGDGDAGIFMVGLLTGTALAHNLQLASSPAGVAPLAPAVVLGGLALAALLGLTVKAE